MFGLRKDYLVLLTVFLFYLFFSVIFLSAHSWQATAFVVFGRDSQITRFVGPEATYVVSDARGYDGQFYYFFARHPFSFKLIEQIIEAPAWRYQRLVYPFLVYILSVFGRPILVAWLLPAVNLLAILLSVYFLIKIFNRYRLSPWLSLFYGLAPGLIFSFFYDLTEPLAYCFVIIGLYYFLKEKFGWSAIFLGLAAFTKEVCLVILIGLIIWLFLERACGYLKKIILYSLPILLFIFWVGSLHFIFPPDGYMQIVNFDLGFPLVGFLTKLKLLFVFGSFWANLIDLFFYLILFGAMILTINQALLKFNWANIITLFFAVFSLMFTSHILFFPKEYSRNFLGLLLLFLLNYIYKKDRLAVLILIFYIVTGILFLPEILYFGYR
jgi:hypothetical protein